MDWTGLWDSQTGARRYDSDSGRFTIRRDRWNNAIWVVSDNHYDDWSLGGIKTLRIAKEIAENRLREVSDLDAAAQFEQNRERMIELAQQVKDIEQEANYSGCCYHDSGYEYVDLEDARELARLVLRCL